MTLVSVLGASGFVGSATCQALAKRGVTVRPVTSPRLSVDPGQARFAWRDLPAEVTALAEELAGSDVVVCCAGNPDASSQDLAGLFGANAALPGVAAAASAVSGARRFVHVSSAAVQGGADRLDASDDTQAFSPYARSKTDGERAVLGAPSPDSTVVFRPPSVHSAERPVTRGIRMLARSPLSSVVGPGTEPTPQAHIENVAAAVGELALTPSDPPPVVIHPWEGWTTGELMRTFGSGREPLHIPAALGPVLRRALRLAATIDRLAPNARRVEMMWFGQRQDESWLTASGWDPPVGREAWNTMITQIDHRPGLTTGTS